MPHVNHEAEGAPTTPNPAPAQSANQTNNPNHTPPKPKLPYIIEGLTVGPMVAEARCIVRHEGMVIFVEGAVPGDVADLRIYKRKKSFAEAAVHKLISPGADRVTPHCQHFGVCGGCKWQHVKYSGQLAAKQQQVMDALERIGQLENLPPCNPIMGSPRTEGYRNKLEFGASNKRWLSKQDMERQAAGEEVAGPGLGFHTAGVFDKVLDIKECHHMPEPANAIRLMVREYVLSRGWEFGDMRAHTGFLRNLMLRCNRKGDWMVLVQFYVNDQDRILPLLQAIQAQFPQVTSLLYVINAKGNDTIYDLEVHTFAGLPYIEEEMEGLRFRIGAKSFFQTNAYQAEELYRVARSLAGLTGNEVVYDLYTGTGTIAQYVARQARKVIGIETVEMAVADARINAEVNGLENCSFFAGDMKNVFTNAFVETHGKPDVIITDPPRAGMHQDVVEVICNLRAPVVVYVSCNPATQARDLALMNHLYEVTHIQPVDMFPHTHHVENVVRLALRETPLAPKALVAETAELAD